MLAIVALWLVVVLLLTCAGLWWLLADAWDLLARQAILLALPPGQRRRWAHLGLLYGVFCGLFVLTAVACAGVALRWW